ncbi:MAG: TIR domain-containing protein [Anaerolineae bacterium]|nr:TIR domain-containing protein [Anaerolineae bacterium]
MPQEHIFLSYRSIESDFALKLASDLKNAGVRLWMDRFDIQAGMKWPDAIQTAIDNGAALIAVLSPDYIVSTYCKNELQRAHELNLPIFPVLLRPLTPQEWPFIIQSVQYEDFTNWQDESFYHQHLGTLIQLLHTKVSTYVSASPDPETQYLNSLIAELETRRGVREYIELEGESDIRPEPQIDDEWGFSELIENDKNSTIRAEKVSLKNIREAIDKHPRFVLLGEPGAGKTTTVRRLALDAARQRLKNPRTAPMPLLLYLPQWRDNVSPLDFIKIKMNWSLGDNLRNLLVIGDVLLYLDGLNEMGAEGTLKAKMLREWIHDSTDAPKRLIVTCRVGDYIRNTFDLGNMPRVVMQELEPPQIRQFVTNYLEDNADGLLTQIFPTRDDLVRQEHWPETERQKIEARSLMRLSRNPYMLSALIFIYKDSSKGQLPRNMGALFQMLVRALWRRETQRSTTSDLQFDTVQAAFARLAFDVINEGLAQDIPLDYALEKLGTSQILYAGVHASYVTISGEYIRFYHQLILEYFAAVELEQRNINEVIIAWREKTRSDLLVSSNPEESKRILSSWIGIYGGRNTERWDQVIIALGGITSNPDTLVKELVAIDTYLATVWITSGSKISPAIYDEIMNIILSEADHAPMAAAITLFPILVDSGELKVIQALIRLLAYGNYMRIAAPASKLLTKVGIDAIPALIEALRNPEEQVRGWATSILGELRDERAVPALIQMLSDIGARYEGKTAYNRDVAANSLKKIGTPEALAAVEKWQTELIYRLIDLDDETHRIIWSIEETFDSIPNNIRNPLSKLFDDDKVQALTYSLSLIKIQVLGIIGNPIAISALERELSSTFENLPKREAILTALRRINTPESLNIVKDWEGKG